MVEFIDITEWEEHEYYGTGGTRDKVIVENPTDNCLYYFKTSLIKNDKKYVYEFWSEVIASEIGKTLGFNVLHYDVAWNKSKIGCLSKSMIDSKNICLLEGYRWLKGFDKNYDVTNKDLYTFQLISIFLNTSFKRQNFIKDLIDIVVFDSIIGNEDRHQENWGIILTEEQIEKSSIFKRGKKGTQSNYTFSPIYDSGSSLGRELDDERIKQILSHDEQLEAYIRRGKSEIRWEGEHGKQRHFELICKIASMKEYRNIVVNIIDAIKSVYSEEGISQIVNSVDTCLPEGYSSYKIPQIRKDFLIKLITLRIDKLLKLQL